MIRVVMLGRLGNNLFQYALGRVLAEKHGVPLIMDASWFNREGWEQVRCLRDLPGPKSGKVRVVRRCSLAARALRNLTGRHYWQYGRGPMLREPELDHSFDTRFTEAPRDCLLFGYFQTPRYFEGFESTLRNELRTDGLGLERGREELAARLRQPGAVAVHIRRGDYAGNANLDLCHPDYYQRAIARIRTTVPDARFFVFSDDPQWAASHLTGPGIEPVGHLAGQSSLAELHLMSLAQHHVIANSSYSWWAAWLGKKDGQQVMMPSRWFLGIHTPINEKRLPHWEIVE